MARGSAPVEIAELVKHHYAMLYRYAYRMCGSAPDAEDLTQEVFCTAQAKLDQLRDKSAARGWLCTILRNCYLRSARAHRRLSLIAWEDGTLDEAEAPPPPDDKIDPQRLQEALDELPEDFRTPLVLFYFEEFSYREIAQQIGVPIGTVMSRLARGKTRLRAMLGAVVAGRLES